MSMLMAFIGMVAPRSSTKSKEPVPMAGSRQAAQNSRILGSSSAILRGVKHLGQQPAVNVVDRRVVEDQTPAGTGMLALISSRIAPLAELNALQSTNARLTSSNRLSA